MDANPGSDAAFPYATNLNILFPPLTRLDADALAAAVRDAWSNQTLCRVNDAVVRLGVVQGEYHWHTHEGDAPRRTDGRTAAAPGHTHRARAPKSDRPEDRRRA